MNIIRLEGLRQMAFGSFMAILWAAGLFGVLEADSLLAKTLLLLLLTPLSLGLDRFVSWLINETCSAAPQRNMACAPVYIKSESADERRAA